MEQSEEVRHDAFHAVRYVHLVAVQLNLVTLQFDVVLDFGEIEHARQVERIVHVQMNPEQRLVAHRVQFAIELLVVLVFQIRRFLGPYRGGVVDDVVLFRIHLLAVFPFRFFAEGYRYGQETAVLAKQLLNLVLFQELFAIVVDVHDDVRSAVGFFCFFYFIGRTSVTAPFYGLCSFLVTFGHDFHFLAHHERRVETQAEVSDDGIGIVFIFIQEVIGAGERDLVDVLVYFFFCHTQSPVAHRDGTVVLVHFDTDFQFARFALEVSFVGQCFQFLRGVYGVRHDFTDKDFMIAVQELFDDGEYVLGRYPNVSFLHDIYCFYCMKLSSVRLFESH